MNFSLDSLLAFSYAAHLGSFTAAARKLGKSQSTISEAIAKLEIDLDVPLFKRTGKHVSLTEAGQVLLLRAEHILEASDQLIQKASELTGGQESRLTLILSDAYQTEHFQRCLVGLDQHFPNLELECIVAEHEDAISLISQGRADLGLIVAEAHYAPDISRATLPQPVDYGIFTAIHHPLAKLNHIEPKHLAEYRLLRIKTTINESIEKIPLLSSTLHWYAPTYLQVLEMTAFGFGWAELPRKLVAAYGKKQLVELNIAGWPCKMAVDVIWSRTKPLGLAGNWLLKKLTELH